MMTREQREKQQHCAKQNQIYLKSNANRSPKGIDTYVQQCEGKVIPSEMSNNSEQSRR